MNGKEIRIFDNPAFGQVRTMFQANGEPLFCAVDIARALGYANPNKAVRDHCKGVNEIVIPSNGGPQRTKFIQEKEVYRLIMRSNQQAAEQFQDWICGEVIPAIRKSGGYVLDTSLFIENHYSHYNPETRAVIKFFLDSMIEHQDEFKAFPEESEVENAFDNSGQDMSVSDFAKVLQGLGIDTGPVKFMAQLRKDRYVMKSDRWNVPTARAIDAGWMKTKLTKEPVTPYGDLGRSPVITPKGQKYFMEKYGRKENHV